MLKRELKVNFKSFFIWLLCLVLLYGFVYLIYPSIMNSENAQMIDEMIKIFPKEILIAFNMDIASMDTAFGWLKSEGFVLILLIIGCYSALIGSNILLKEENDKTIEYLNSLPIKRNDIVISKTITGLIYIISMILLIGIFNFIGLTISGEFNTKQYLLLSIIPLFSSIVIYFICIFISTFTHKTKKMLGISLGIVLISYVLNTLSMLSETTELLKYFSIFTLADIRNVIINIEINPLMIIISIILSTLFFILTIKNYNKKELL